MGFVTAHPRWRAHQSAVPGPIMGISHTCVSGSGGTSDGIVSPVAPQRQQQPGRVATRAGGLPCPGAMSGGDRPNEPVLSVSPISSPLLDTWSQPRARRPRPRSRLSRRRSPRCAHRRRTALPRCRRSRLPRPAAGQRCGRRSRLPPRNRMIRGHAATRRRYARTPGVGPCRLVAERSGVHAGIQGMPGAGLPPCTSHVSATVAPPAPASRRHARPCSPSQAAMHSSTGP